MASDLASGGANSRWAVGILLLPPMTMLAVLFIIPICLMIGYSFWSVDANYQLVRSFEFTQYRKILADSLYTDTLLSSVVMALITTVVCVLLSVPLAWYIARIVPPRWRILLIVGLILPGWVSVLIRTYSMNLVLSETGMLNWTLESLGIIDAPLKILFSQPAVIIGLAYIYLPYTLVPIYATIEKIDPALLEAAENLGADRLRRFLRVSLPLIMPGIAAGCIITFIPALGEFLVPNLLGGLQGIMYGNLISTAFQAYNWPLGAALSVVLLLGIAASLCVFFLVVNVHRSLLARR